MTTIQISPDKVRVRKATGVTPYPDPPGYDFERDLAFLKRQHNVPDVAKQESHFSSVYMQTEWTWTWIEIDLEVK